MALITNSTRQESKIDTKNLRKKLWDEVTCSICLEYFTDPVILDCDHSFCHACIAGSWQYSCSHTLCPLYKQTMWSKKFKANKHLASIAEITKQLNERKNPEGRPLCGNHEEPLKLFCKDDKTLTCVVCDKSKECRDHNVLPVEEATKESKPCEEAAIDNFTGLRLRTRDVWKEVLEQTEGERVYRSDSFWEAVRMYSAGRSVSTLEGPYHPFQQDPELDHQGRQPEEPRARKKGEEGGAEDMEDKRCRKAGKWQWRMGGSWN